MKKITAERFKAATGFDPENDDLERCNCRKVGQIGHSSCGWNDKRNMPNFMHRDEADFETDYSLPKAEGRTS